MAPPPGPAAPPAVDQRAPTLTIAEATERTGISAHTLRYYERVGLLDVERDAGGRRRYSQDALGRVVFVSRLRWAELPIRDIARYLELVRDGPHTEPDRLAILESHRAVVERRQQELAEALDVLDHKIATYRGSSARC